MQVDFFQKIDEIGKKSLFGTDFLNMVRNGVADTADARNAVNDFSVGNRKILFRNIDIGRKNFD